MISPTMLSVFNECPYKFKIIYVDNRRPMYKPEFEFGKTIHRIIAEYYKLLPSDATPSDVPMILGSAIKRVMGYLDENVVRYFRCFENFEKQRLSWHINPKPLFFEAEVKRGQLRGVIDAAFKRNGQTIIVDWKTGMDRDPTVDERLKIQGNFYMYLLDAKEMYFVFIRHSTFHKLTYDEDFLREKLKAFLDACNKNDYQRREGHHCERCEVNLHCYFDKYGLRWWEL
jgi:hypothetical protein